MSDTSFQWSNFEEENFICNKIFSWILTFWLNDNKESIWMLPDVDEFIRFDQMSELSFQGNFIFRSFCIDWFLDCDLLDQDISSSNIFQLIKKNKLKGKLADLWDNPFYKDFIFLLNENNFLFFKDLKAVTGFHRFINKNKVFFPPNSPYFIVDHMRIIPRYYFLKKFEKWKELVKNTKDDWLLFHLDYLFSIMTDYNSFYVQNETLMFFNEIYAKIEENSKINYNYSFFDSVIMKKNIITREGAKPSDLAFNEENKK